MEARVCWRCLVRASPENTTFSTFPLRNSTPGKSASFSTSTPSLAAKTPAFVPQRGAKTTFIKKKGKRQNEVKAKRPAPGERKAYRKRIVLSNTNAVQIPGIEDFSVEHLGTEESKGKVLGIPGAVIDQLRAVEAFKPTQLWGLFRTPRMLIRGETIEYGRLFEELEANRSSLRRVLVGDRGNGKSLILLQAMTIAFLKGWTVINIPEGNFYHTCPDLQSNVILFTLGSCKFQLRNSQSAIRITPLSLALLLSSLSRNHIPRNSFPK